MSIFKVVKTEGYRDLETVLETDDWVLAQHRAIESHRSHVILAPWKNTQWLAVRGTHPSHKWGPPDTGQANGGWEGRTFAEIMPGYGILLLGMGQYQVEDLEWISGAYVVIRRTA
jgi:hypothetical protein